jgi:thioredoxin-dependent peroxiredoxin
MTALTKGDQAPDFHLVDQNGNGWRLGDYKDQFLVFLFYKQDHTPGCLQLMEGFRDHYEEFTRLGAKIVGVSKDDSASHREFSAQCRLPFNLLADPELETAEAYKVLTKGGDIRRGTFLIGPDGTILKIYPEVKDTTKHAEAVLLDLQDHVVVPAEK